MHNHCPNCGYPKVGEKLFRGRYVIGEPCRYCGYKAVATLPATVGTKLTVVQMTEVVNLLQEAGRLLQLSGPAEVETLAELARLRTPAGPVANIVCSMIYAAGESLSMDDAGVPTVVSQDFG